MKNSNILILCIISFLVLVACGEDRTHEFYEQTEENQWIYNTMKDIYLWKEDIKQPVRTQYFTPSQKFFSSLLNKSDKASFFTDTISSNDYGMSVTLMRDPIAEKPSAVYALVLFVEPDSPADIAGIRRGTWISAVNGKKLTMTSETLFQQGDAAKFATEYIEYDNEADKHFWVANDTIEIAQSAEYPANNIYIDSIYTVRGKSVGYILCNNFNGEDFMDKANGIAEKFIAQNITDLIIDLRYNKGGDIANAAGFASMLVPQEIIGTPFCMLKDRNGEVETTYNYTGQKFSLGDKNIYFIISGKSKGAVESVVNSVNASRDMYEVFVIGKNSYGLNVVTKEIESPYGFKINPAIATVCSADGNILPAEGITPDYIFDELEQKNSIHPLGNEQEYLLYNTLYIIATGTAPAGATNNR